MIAHTPLRHSRTEQVKALFTRTHLYLEKDFDVSTRCLIVRHLLGDVSNSRILDLGCGDGRMSLQYLSETNRVVLVDLSDAMLEIARKNTPDRFKGHVAYLNSDLHEFDTSDLFDIVLCIGVLAHVVSVEKTIAKASSLLKPGGRCIFQITDDENMSGKLLNTYYAIRDSLTGRRRYALNRTGQAYVTSLARRNGLRVIGKRQYLAPLPGMWRMPNAWLLKYQVYTLTHDVFSRIGSEVLLLCLKEV